MVLNKRDQSLIIVVGVILACGAIWYFWLSPTAQSITLASQKISSLQSDQLKLQQRISFIDATSKDLANSADAQKLIALAAPSGGGIDNLLASFDSMAVSSGVSLASVQPQTSATNTSELDVTVNVSGTFSAVQSFVSALEKNERPIAIKTMSLSGASSTDGATLVSATLSLTTVQVVNSATGGTK